MQTHIQIKLFATLQRFMPASAENYAIEAGTSIRTLLQQIDIPEDKAKLIFIDGLKAELTTVLKGGERIGIFPPVGGG
ncbi:MAG: MoaD/ThiS family protein [Desulfobacterales bacterium]|nr:MoaD/ThiS family protein [Desulfobacterales bacterium]MCK5202801.1 MoaD/ThiS family protein [Desulfobacterales bacterium]MCK5416883.1 MoaD/ThiS family protein [Desulfobacterales bacterium]MCK5487416.1 MoaD/ThiS family protein [Desulfobacterales bacterium]